MAYQFPKTISAARVASFVSTAAWIQGAAASEASLPEEALNNFLRRHGVTKVARQAPAATTTPAPEPEDEEDDKESDSSVDSDGISSVSSPGSTASAPSEEDDKEEDDKEDDDKDDDAAAAAANSSGPPQAGIAAGASGQPAIESPGPPPLSTGAKVAIGVWSAVAVVAILGLAFFFTRRRRRARLAQDEMNALRDEELARSHQEMSQGGTMQFPPPPPPPAPVMEPAYLRGSQDGNGNARAPSGQWMATPPWQEDPPTWRDSHPWRQSQPSVAAGPSGLPSGIRPPLPPFAMQNTKPEDDRRTEFTAETESTIFAYR
ncbi:uncharacterized protein F4822DRAFT_286076 [Hypoxylon trugodes]|uniref:uncharacterized protein n=1 Tax=Hypoxylon trugodes TaxID=326681 RepID=UPI00218CC59F|nr:uncharacterized protein F4822DRAFT_286076 [Hypoxylon trugodes]KAI1387544.1 hypothetical protein F4822DRAFT_286076 [Hypoxylon trugodes]